MTGEFVPQHLSTCGASWWGTSLWHSWDREFEHGSLQFPVDIQVEMSDTHRPRRRQAPRSFPPRTRFTPIG